MSGFESFGTSHIVWLFILGITGAATVRYCPACGRKAGAVLAVLGRILPVLYEIGLLYDRLRLLSALAA